MRIKKVQQLLSELQVDVLLIENPVDVFYITGAWFSLVKLFVWPKKAQLIVDGRYYAQAKKQVCDCEVVLASQEAVKVALQEGARIGFDSAWTSVDRLEQLQKIEPHKKWSAVSRPIKNIRVCKDAEEVAALQRAAHVTWKGYQTIVQKLKEGVSEEEIALEFEICCRKMGASRLSFDPIIAFGENSAYPHHRSGKDRLKKNQNVLLDLGAVVDDYRGDMTRVFFFGEVNRELLRMWKLVQQAHDEAVCMVQPGVRLGTLDAKVHSFFAHEGVEALFAHGLGHGIGLETHEYPSVRADGEDRDLLLRAGMVFTIEPGLYLPGVGGVRYENTFVVTKDGVKNLYAEL